MLEKLKLLLGSTDSTQDELLVLLLQQTESMMLAELNRSTLPADAQDLLVEIAADAYWLRRQAVGDGAGEVTGSVSSLSDNGQSVSYRDSAYVETLKNTAAGLLKNYSRRLDAFRRPRW